MSNPVFQQPATYTARRLIREAQVLCRIGSSVDACDFLGSDAGGVERDETLATILNLSLEEFYRDFPQQNVVTAGSTTTALDPFSSLPPTLHENDIMGIYWSEAGSEQEGYKVSPCAPQDVLNLTNSILAGKSYAEWPSYYTVLFDRKSGAWKIRWLPTPLSAHEYTIVYRAQPTVFTGPTLDGAAIVPVPDSQIEPLIWLVAERIQQRNTGTRSFTPKDIREQYEVLRRGRAYIEPTTDQLVNAAFTPAGEPVMPAWADKAAFEATQNNYDGDTF